MPLSNWDEVVALKARPGSLYAEFYTNGWVPDMEVKFLTDLMVYANIKGRPLKEDDRHVITQTMLHINNKFKSKFDYYYIFKRFQFAHKRFVTMNWIINHPNVRFDDDTEVITTSKSTWDIICSVHQLGSVYRVCKEPFWPELKTIFAFDCNIANHNRCTTLEGNKYNFGVPCYLDDRVESSSIGNVPPDAMSSNMGPDHFVGPPPPHFPIILLSKSECSQRSSANSCSVNDR